MNDKSERDTEDCCHSRYDIEIQCKKSEMLYTVKKPEMLYTVKKEKCCTLKIKRNIMHSKKRKNIYI